LLGDDFDPGRHRCGVDLAFGLQRHDSFALLPGELQRMIDADRAASPLVGFNLSGLIYHDAVGSRLQYGFRADYAALVVEFLRWLLRHSTANLVLIPHVMTALGHHESDAAASQSVAELLSQDFPGRVVVSPSSLDQNQVKWLIGQTDWFCGTRMHATIAALSSGVPTATIAYSDKALGVFESCGQAGHVVDPRQLDTRQVMEQLIRSFRDRESAKLALAAQLPQVDIQFRQQISLIAARVRSLAEDRNGAGRGVSADAGEQQS
jgi:polysaccharide pyruvyl transferase WcaK-like protein